MSDATIPSAPAPETAADAQTLQTSFLYNEDLAPIPIERGHGGTYNYAAPWIAMSVNIPTCLLASSMIAGGMSGGCFRATVITSPDGLSVIRDFKPMRALYGYVWFMGFGVSFAAYWILTPRPGDARH